MDSIDDGTLNLPGCVLLGKDHQHHTGQAIEDIDDSMPVYMPNGGSTTRQWPAQRSTGSTNGARAPDSDSDAYAE